MSEARVMSILGKTSSSIGKSHATKGTSAKESDNRSIIAGLQRLSRARLEALLVSLFNNTDDALFERADRSHSNADQQMYFESMRQLRLSREGILQSFHASVAKAFEVLQASQGAEAPPEEEPDFDEISLVQNEDLEISVAISGIVSKITSQHSLQIMQLTKRIDHVTPQITVTEKNNPLAPQSLGESFATALSVLEVDITIRIVLLKLFERFVMEQLADFYKEANAQLVEAGVLKDLKHPYRDAKRTSRQSSSAAAPSVSATVGGESSAISSYGSSEVQQHAAAEFGVIQRLLAQAQGRPGIALPRDDRPQITTSQLVDVLSILQTTNEVPKLDQNTMPSALNLSALLANKAQQVTGSDKTALRQADDDVVNFVGMLFDYILNDRNLAIPMKALISRLQIPIVKLAILDKGFFEQAGHPARRLLNELSSAGIGWSSANELKRDALYNKVEATVTRVLNEFQGNPGIFETLTNELIDFVKRDQRRTTIVEQRLKDTEIGKAKTVEAKRSAQNVINQKAAGLRLHPSVGRFVSETWSKVLVFVCVKYGVESDAWTDSVSHLDALLWSIQPLNTVKDVERRDESREELLAKLRTGMRLINIPEEEAAETLDQLRAHLTEISVHDRAFLRDDAPCEHPNQDEEREVIKEVKLAEPVEDETVEVVPEPQHMQAVDQLSEGRWVELNDENSALQRCKLATIVGSGKRYIFVNRRGMKVAERSRIQLAAGLGQGTVTLLEDSEVFDKALEAVIGNLRHLRSQPSR